MGASSVTFDLLFREFLFFLVGFFLFHLRTKVDSRPGSPAGLARYVDSRSFSPIGRRDSTFLAPPPKNNNTKVAAVRRRTPHRAGGADTAWLGPHGPVLARRAGP